MNPLILIFSILNQVQKEKELMVVRCLCDMGADLSFITKALAEKVERRNRGGKGEGKYKVIDAFKRVHYFTENITITFLFENLINLPNSLLSCKFVIVDIPFNSDVILGDDDIEEENESMRVDWKKIKLSMIYGSEWIDEEQDSSERATEIEREWEGEAFCNSILSSIR